MKGPNVGHPTKLNIGCGPHYLPDFINNDLTEMYDGETGKKMDIAVFNAVSGIPYKDLDFILVNHVLCTMNQNYAACLLRNCYDALKPGGKLLVIDVDVLKAFQAYIDGNEKALFIPDGSIDYKFTTHLSGYGTRLSLYTERLLEEKLEALGFKEVTVLESSKYDLRPLESLRVEGTK